MYHEKTQLTDSIYISADYATIRSKLTSEITERDVGDGT
jgi:hypothetical protein